LSLLKRGARFFEILAVKLLKIELSDWLKLIKCIAKISIDKKSKKNQDNFITNLKTSPGKNIEKLKSLKKVGLET
jgi:hypothetical protein